jgi:hypothetical protein
VSIGQDASWSIRLKCERVGNAHGGRRNSADPDDAFDDWVVRDDGGQGISHYPTREAAELAAQEFVRGRGGAVVIHLPDGRYE